MYQRCIIIAHILPYHSIVSHAARQPENFTARRMLSGEFGFRRVWGLGSFDFRAGEFGHLRFGELKGLGLQELGSRAFRV